MSQTSFQTVVVGVDFSPYSKIVVKQALQLALEHKAELVFVHTLNNLSLMTGEVYVDIDKDFIKPLKQEVASFYKLKKIAPGAKVIVNLGSPRDGVIAAASDFDSPLIVVGHKGKNSMMGRFFLGSTAEQLALHSPFPVWIHRGNSVRRPNRILLPCDFSRRTAASFETVKIINGVSKSKYEFFHVAPRPIPMFDVGQYKKTMAAIRKKENSHQKDFQRQHPEVPLVSKTGEPASLIAKESRKFDLIAMAPHNREGLFSGFGSVTAKVVRQGNTPVLITR